MALENFTFEADDLSVMREIVLELVVVGGYSDQASPVPNVLGTDFWRRTKSVFDFAAQTLYLIPDTDYKDDPSEHVGIGLIPRLAADKRMYVADLGIPSPAQEAGLLIGDDLVAINGLVVTQTPLDRIE